uniref:Uncharacterized protein n=1 Tax=Anguilla anguilla TaxID=7936 RepID=A0A0E9W4V4_ANGAN
MHSHAQPPWVCCPAPFCSDIHLKCAQPTVRVY